MRAVSTILFDFDNQPRNFFIFFGISLFSHIFIFALIVLVHFPNFSIRHISPQSSIQVDLVTLNPDLPLPPPKGRKDGKEAVKPIDKPAEPQKQVQQESIRIKEASKKEFTASDFAIKEPGKPEIKKSLKKETLNTEKVLENAVKQIEKQTLPAQSLTDSLEKLKQEVQEDSRGMDNGTSSAAAGGQYRKGLTQIEIFQAEVSIRLKNNWVFSQKLAGETKGLESRLVVKILPDGSITDVWFEKRSGNEYLDESAYKTIMKSNPFPPLPAGYPYYHLVLGFTPFGLQ